MTKAEALNTLATRQDQLASEVWAMAHLMSLSASHEAGVLVGCMRRDAQKLRALAARPSMETPIDFKEPV